MGFKLSTLSRFQENEMCYGVLATNWSKTMSALIFGIFIFGGLHIFSVLLPAMRNRLSAWLGEQRYKNIYSIVSLIGIILMGFGYWHTRFDGTLLYQPLAGARHITMLLVLLGFILMGANGGKGYLRLWLQNPFSIGISLWAIGHLLANGKTAVVAIYATFLVISVLDIIFSVARNDRVAFEPVIRRDITAVIAGVVLYAIFLFGFHPYVLGVPVVR
jgi:uncharacterized membrane protein